MTRFWQQISAVVAAAEASALADELERRGALAVTMQDAADEPLFEPPPGATPLWKTTRVTALFDSDADFEALAQSAGQAAGLGHAAWRVTQLADQTWERVWMDRFAPMRFGERLWICPRHRRVDADDAIVVRLDPGLAFGTGTHPTTALCLEALDRLAASAPGFPDWELLDYGCGSGILAIAALKLGARGALAVDLDPQALQAAGSNARENGVSCRLRTAAPAALPVAYYNLLLANILAGPLVQLAPLLSAAAAPGCRLVLSGILRAQADEVRAAYAGHFTMDMPHERDGWICLTGTRRT
ncbi:MAG: 50S ribosomal protein L11 methyltransferase [Pseudomonadota bacterium]